MGNLWLGMRVLTQKTTIWPDPLDLYMGGSKMFLNLIIQKSSEAMGLLYPLAMRVRPTEDTIRDIMEGKIKGSLKREFSSHDRHVFSRHTKDVGPKFKQAIAEEHRAYLSLKNDFQTPLWFIQPYIAGQKYLGKILALVVNGVLFKAFTAKPDSDDPHELRVQEPSFFTPLSKLRYGLVHPYTSC